MPDGRLPLPTFLIIGAQKSATRWLRHNLGLHPEIFTAEDELSFFNSQYRVRQLGEAWYRARFEGWNGEPIVGEACPGYMIPRHSPRTVARRIEAMLPEVRLLAVLRNPVDRAHSAMLHQIKRRRLDPDTRLLDVVASAPPDQEYFGLVSSGWYAASLAPYVKTFGDRLLVLLHDDVRDDPRRVYARALAHVGATAGFEPPGLGEVLFSNRPLVPTEVRSVTPDERRTLYEYFRGDIWKLEKLLGRDFSHWGPVTGDPSSSLATNPFPAAYARVADWVQQLADRVGRDQLDAPTPCRRWDVRALLSHLVDRARLHEAAFARVPVRDRTAAADDDLAAAYRRASAGLRAALAGPDSTRGTIELRRSVAEHAALASGLLVVDQLAHGWDLAKATGQEPTIPHDLAQLADTFARSVYALMMRDPKWIAKRVPVPATATPTERFVAYLGRDPAWSAG